MKQIVKYTCPVCNGFGNVQNNHPYHPTGKCNWCSGLGYIEKEQEVPDDDGSIHLRSPRPSVVTKEDLEKLFNEGADEFIGEYITQPVMSKRIFIEVVSKLLNL